MVTKEADDRLGVGCDYPKQNNTEREIEQRAVPHKAIEADRVKQASPGRAPAAKPRWQTPAAPEQTHRRCRTRRSRGVPKARRFAGVGRRVRIEVAAQARRPRPRPCGGRTANPSTSMSRIRTSRLSSRAGAGGWRRPRARPRKYAAIPSSTRVVVSRARSFSTLTISSRPMMLTPVRRSRSASAVASSGSRPRGSGAASRDRRDRAFGSPTRRASA